jgi:hypothetical protein
LRADSNLVSNERPLWVMNCLKKRSALGPFIPQCQTSLKLAVQRFNAGSNLCTQQFVAIDPRAIEGQLSGAYNRGSRRRRRFRFSINRRR